MGMAFFRALFQCKRQRKRQNTVRLLSVLLATLLISAGFTPSALADYPLARVINNTEYTVTGQVQYVSMFCKNDNFVVAPGKTWTASSRGVCLIDDIIGSTSGAIGKYGESTAITPYHASPATSYGTFLINAYSGSYRIFSQDEWDDVSDTKQGKSPGFYFVNKTAWPLTYSLDQVGCLHHGIIPTGQGTKGVVKVDTGAVWFTLRVAIQPDGIDPVSNWDCVQPVAEIVGDVALAAVTGGSSAVAKTSGKVIVKQVAKEVAKEAAKTAVKSAAKKVISGLAKDELGKILSDAGSVELYGQYAGYAWPFRCDNMPEYHIIGGPVPLRDENGEIYLERGTPFKVMKVNDCGDNMMLGSRRSMESDQSAFSTWPGGGGSSLPETGAPDCVTFYTSTNAGGKSEQLCGMNATTPIPRDFSIPYRNKIMSFKCNSGVKSLLLLNQREPLSHYSCKGGNVVNTDGSFKSATAAVYYSVPCCNDAPKASSAAQKAAIEAARQQAIQRQQAAAAEQQRLAEAERLAAQARADAANAAEATRWTGHSKKLYDTCALRGTVRSVDSADGVGASINMSNAGSKGVYVYWINTQGEEVDYSSQDAPIQSIASGPYAIEEYGSPGYWYIAVDDTGECVGLGNAGELNNVFTFNPDLVVPGAHPRKAASAQNGYDQNGYDQQNAYDQSGYDQQNAYDQSGYDQNGYSQGGYVDPATGMGGTPEYVDNSSVYQNPQDPYADQGTYQEDMSGYADQSQLANAPAVGPGCEYLGQVASNDDGEIVEVQLENWTNDTIDIYWINASGEPSNYAGDGGTVMTLPAQSFQAARTRIGHIFAASGSDGVCLGVTAVSTTGETIGFSPLQ